jgi:hypothetical protein
MVRTCRPITATMLTGMFDTVLRTARSTLRKSSYRSRYQADRQPFMLHREVPGASGAAMRGHRRARAGGPAWWLSLPWFEPWHQGQHRWSEDYARKAAGREERSLAGGVHAAGRRSRLRRCSEGQP